MVRRLAYLAGAVLVVALAAQPGAQELPQHRAHSRCLRQHEREARHRRHPHRCRQGRGRRFRRQARSEYTDRLSRLWPPVADQRAQLQGHRADGRLRLGVRQPRRHPRQDADREGAGLHADHLCDRARRRATSPRSRARARSCWSATARRPARAILAPPPRRWPRPTRASSSTPSASTSTPPRASSSSAWRASGAAPIRMRPAPPISAPASARPPPRNRRRRRSRPRPRSPSPSRSPAGCRSRIRTSAATG